MDILKLLEKNRIVDSIDVVDFRQFDGGFYLKLVIKFTNNTYLHTKEYFDASERNYSFHWQDAAGEVISRWDNAPHFPHISTFPHHKHFKSEVFPSHEISLKEVISHIEKLIL
jgi:hypothetical protein